MFSRQTWIAALLILPLCTSQLLGQADTGSTPPPVLDLSGRWRLTAPLAARSNTVPLVILELIAAGLSNREIAAKVFVSENTVKTHSSRVFEKLGARRRTQAVQLGKEFGLIP